MTNVASKLWICQRQSCDTFLIRFSHFTCQSSVTAKVRGAFKAKGLPLTEGLNKLVSRHGEWGKQGTWRGLVFV